MSPGWRVSFGFLSLLVGFAGLVLPILQGWLFLSIGLVLLSRDVPFFRRVRVKLEQRFPNLAKLREFAEKKIHRRKKP